VFLPTKTKKRTELWGIWFLKRCHIRNEAEKNLDRKTTRLELKVGSPYPIRDDKPPSELAVVASWHDRSRWARDWMSFADGTRKRTDRKDSFFFVPMSSRAKRGNPDSKTTDRTELNGGVTTIRKGNRVWRSRIFFQFHQPERSEAVQYAVNIWVLITPKFRNQTDLLKRERCWDAMNCFVHADPDHRTGRVRKQEHETAPTRWND